MTRFFKFTAKAGIYAISLAFLLLSLACSKSDDTDNRTEIEYFFQLESSTNYIVDIIYTNATGNEVIVSQDSDDINLIDGNLEWSKKVNVNLPFEAELKVHLSNFSDRNINYTLIIYKDGEPLDFVSANVPAISETEANVSITVAE